VSRRAIQVIFVILGLLWGLFCLFELFVSVYGDCVDDELCVALKNTSAGLVLWRGLAVTLILFIAYRFFRKEPEE
jgi:hypothetical protein